LSLPPDVIVCSFFTDDEYYRGWAKKLEENLDDLGIAHVLREVHKEPGQDWADICRQKVAFLDTVCRENPDARVFWTDVDCEILDLPAYVRNFTADIIGFQHGFSRPMEIGYKAATRFWAPSFIGVNTTPAARKFVSDAADFERLSTLKATDDYFFEESWRANADSLSFQVIPAGGVLGRGNGDVTAFYAFGSSGNVPQFRNLVVQHTAPGAKAAPTSREAGAIAWKVRVKVAAYRALKQVDAVVTRVAPQRAPLVRDWVKQHPLIHRIRPITPPKADNHRSRLLAQAVAVGQRGDLERLDAIERRLHAGGILSAAEAATVDAAKAFASYATFGSPAADSADTTAAVPLVWWPRPFPGNFGDWLSPLIVASVANTPVEFVPATGNARKPHLVGLGSIAKFANEHSVVVGSGASAGDAELHPGARYHSLRGPLTADILTARGGPAVTTFGDPGVLLRRVLPMERPETNGRLALVRHFTHATLPVRRPAGLDEISVLQSSPESLRTFIEKLHQYDGIVTSAMHVAIACHSYGIPVALIGFEGAASTVAGDGMKYRDYSLGAGLERLWEPQQLILDLRNVDLRSMLDTEYVAEEKLDEVEAAIKNAVADWRDIVA